MKSLDEIESAAIIAKISKWKVTFEPEEVLAMVLYIRASKPLVAVLEQCLVEADAISLG